MTDKQYLKITEQDMLIAEEFFDNNEKHFNEFIIGVMNYYRGREVKIKTKIVEKYFKTYQKTMDNVIQGRETGGKKKQKPNPQVIDLQEEKHATPPTPPNTLPETPPDTQINKSKEVKEYIKENNENSEQNIYNQNQNLTEKQLQAFNQVLEIQPETKKEFEDLPKKLDIDTDYYNEFIDLWNKHVFKFTDRKVGIQDLIPFEKNQLIKINKPISEISKALFILFNQKDKETLPQCWIRPNHFLKDDQFFKYYQSGLEYEEGLKTNKAVITQFYQTKNK